MKDKKNRKVTNKTKVKICSKVVPHRNLSSLQGGTIPKYCENVTSTPGGGCL